LLDKSRKVSLLCVEACFRTRGETFFDCSSAPYKAGIDSAAGNRISDDLTHCLQSGIVYGPTYTAESDIHRTIFSQGRRSHRPYGPDQQKIREGLHVPLLYKLGTHQQTHTTGSRIKAHRRGAF
jgi:hypothetical protein